MDENLTPEQITKYAQWVYHECDDPISEIDWLVQVILHKDDQKYFYEDIKVVIDKLD